MRWCLGATFRKRLRIAQRRPQEEIFHALLDPSQGCAFCHRPLRDEISKLVGVGPDCARKHRIPHSMAAANKRLEIRRKILGESEQIKH